MVRCFCLKVINKPWQRRSMQSSNRTFKTIAGAPRVNILRSPEEEAFFNETFKGSSKNQVMDA